MKKELLNFPDQQCSYGYRTLCHDCREKTTDIDVSQPIYDYFPSDHCELCKCKGYVVDWINENGTQP